MILDVVRRQLEDLRKQLDELPDELLVRQLVPGFKIIHENLCRVHRDAIAGLSDKQLFYAAHCLSLGQPCEIEPAMVNMLASQELFREIERRCETRDLEDWWKQGADGK
jgi:hypothetical protein